MRNELIPRDVGITRPGVFCRLGKKEIQEDRIFNIKDNKDLIKKEDILQTKNVTQTVSRLETFIRDDRKEYQQNHCQKVRLFKNQ